MTVESSEVLRPSDLAIRLLEQLCHLVPVDLITVEANGEPPSRAMVRRQLESLVLPKRVQIAGIGKEVEGLPRADPARARWRVEAVEQCKAALADPEERSILERGLFGTRPGAADPPDRSQRCFVISLASVHDHRR